MSDWLKTLRGGGEATPRSKVSINRRYSQVIDEADLNDTADSSNRLRTPKPSGYDRPWRDNGSAGPPSSSRTPRRPPTSGGQHGQRLARQASVADDSPGIDTASIAGSDDMSINNEGDDYSAMEGESVQAFVRVRPINKAELADNQYTCTQLLGTRKVVVNLRHRPEPYEFCFDWVLPETATQQDVFEMAGAPIVDNCMAGYNSSIFAYGQTGAGKTYTMQGVLKEADEDTQEKRGLAPRVFEYLFQKIEQEQDEKGRDNLKFCCRVSMLEIYNEVISDLLAPSGGAAGAGINLQVREDIKRGCYVEDLSEEIVQNVEDAMRLMKRGAENRHVGETRLNHESSRSHSVFTVTIERNSKSGESGLTNILFSRLNLIDLAGSERIKSGAHGGSGAQGEHFKEACHINKSLTTLGRVIMELVEAQRSGKRGRHVPYRDSRLTFLLQDSLGGNAKTMIIANISPSSSSAQETLSTLYFVRRAKHIRNRATINIDTRGDVALLQKEIVRLNTELDNLRRGFTDPAVQENKELHERLNQEAALKAEMRLKQDGLMNDVGQLRRERKRMEEKMTYIQGTANQLQQLLFRLIGRMETYDSANSAMVANVKKLAEAEVEELQLHVAAAEAALADERASHAAAMQELATTHGALAAAQQAMSQRENEHDGASKEAAALAKALEDAHASRRQDAAGAAAAGAAAAAALAEAQASAARSQQQYEELKERAVELQRLLEESEAAVAEARQQGEDAAARADGLSEGLTAAGEALAAERAACAALREEGAGMAKQLEELEGRLAQENEAHAATRAQLSTTDADLQAAQEAVAAAIERVGETSEALHCAKGVNADLDGQLQALAAELKQVQESSEAQNVSLQQQLDATQAQLTAAQASVAELTSSLQHTTTQHSDAEAATKTLSAQLEERDIQLAAARQGGQEAEQAASQQVEKLQADLATATQQAEQERAAAAAAACEAERQLAAAAEQLQAVRSELQANDQLLQTERAALEASKGAVFDLEGALAAANAALAATSVEHEQVQAQRSTLESQLAEATSALQERSAALEHGSAEMRDAHQQHAAAQAKAAAELAAAEAAAAVLREEKATLLSAAAASKAALETAAHEGDLIKQKLAGTEESVAALKQKLEGSRAEAAEWREKASRASEGLAAAQAVSAERKSELSEQRAATAAAQAALEARQREREAEMSGQMDVLRRELVELETARASREAEVGQLRKEAGVNQARLQEAKEELSQAQSSLSAQSSTMRDKDRLIADLKSMLDKTTNETTCIQKVHTAEVHHLQHEVTEMQSKLSDQELLIKEELVRKARHTRAFVEIRRLIDWAATPPASLQASLQAAGDSVSSRSSSPRSMGGPGSLASHLSSHPFLSSVRSQPDALVRKSLEAAGYGNGSGEHGGIAALRASGGLPVLTDSVLLSVSAEWASSNRGDLMRASDQSGAGY